MASLKKEYKEDQLVFSFINCKQAKSFSNLVAFLEQNSLPLRERWAFYYFGRHGHHGGSLIDTEEMTKNGYRDYGGYLEGEIFYWNEYLKDEAEKKISKKYYRHGWKYVYEMIENDQELDLETNYDSEDDYGDDIEFEEESINNDSKDDLDKALLKLETKSREPYQAIEVYLENNLSETKCENCSQGQCIFSSWYSEGFFTNKKIKESKIKVKKERKKLYQKQNRTIEKSTFHTHIRYNTLGFTPLSIFPSLKKLLDYCLNDRQPSRNPTKNEIKNIKVEGLEGVSFRTLPLLIISSKDKQKFDKLRTYLFMTPEERYQYYLTKIKVGQVTFISTEKSTNKIAISHPTEIFHALSRAIESNSNEVNYFVLGIEQLILKYSSGHTESETFDGIRYSI